MWAEYVNDNSGVVTLPYALVTPYSTCPVAGSFRLHEIWALLWETALAVTALIVGPTGAGVGVGVAVAAGVGVAVGVGLAVAAGVGVAVATGVGVAVAAGVGVAVAAGVGVAVAAGVGVAVAAGVGVAVAAGVGVAVGAGLAVGADTAAGVSVGPRTTNASTVTARRVVDARTWIVRVCWVTPEKVAVNSDSRGLVVRE
jgi:hypothetical protein